MAQDRRVIMKTSVLPTATTAYAAVPGSLEEYNITKATYNKNTISTTIGRLGGASKMTDISSTQWGDGWSSLTSGSWSEVATNWNSLTYLYWDGFVGITSTQLQLSSDSSDVQFCYIKNTGSTAVIISLDGQAGTPTYPLKLSSGASTMFRGYSTNLKINEVYVKTASGTSTVDYIIAQ